MFTILVVIQFFSLVPRSAAGTHWVCPPGQPQACYEEHSGRIAQIGQYIRDEQDELSTLPARIDTCWEEERSLNDREKRQREKVAAAKTRLSETRSQYQAMDEIRNREQTALDLIDQYQGAMNSILADMMAALRSDLSGRKTLETDLLEYQLRTQIAASVSDEDKHRLELSLKIVKEIQSALLIAEKNRDEFNRQIAFALFGAGDGQSSGDFADYHSISKAALRTAVSSADDQNVGVMEMLSSVRKYVAETLSGLRMKCGELDSRISALESSLEGAKKKLSGLKIDASSQHRQCRALQGKKDAIPGKIASYRQDIQDLRDRSAGLGCYRLYCKQEENMFRNSDRKW